MSEPAHITASNIRPPMLIGPDAVPARKPMPRGLDAAWHRVGGITARWRHTPGRYLRLAQRIESLSAALVGFSDTALRDRAVELRTSFRLGRESREDLLGGVALVREVAFRTLNQRPYPVQIAGALAMIDGCVAEMATGEGKTLTATIPAVIAGWRGRGCHVVTVNDYLAERDANWMKHVFEFCGLSVGFVVSSAQPDDRRAAYACDITYSTNKELAADFLRDRLALGQIRSNAAAIARPSPRERDRAVHGLDQVVMRGLHTAIVDEADSVLIDEAITPLIIAAQAQNAERDLAYHAAAKASLEFQPGLDYAVNHAHREIELTRAGRSRLEGLSESTSGAMSGLVRRTALVLQALTAKELYTLGKHYVIENGKVAIIDEFTGRMMADRTWRDGLHQAIETKESLQVTPINETLARISFQRFFRGYKRLCGMSGTVRELRSELWATYALPVVTIPTHQPCQRVQKSDETFVNASAKWHRAVQLIEDAHHRGQPVLVGCASVQTSEYLSEMLTARGIPHALLNARSAAKEAAIVERAGERSAVTIATNMAGRGTDIRLALEARQRGGLLVLATERHESRRIDRQLFGRSGRQGDPGVAMAVVSLEDELLTRHAPLARAIRRLAIPGHGSAPHVLSRLAFFIAQRRAQAKARSQRRAVLLADDWLDESLAFSERAG